MYRNSQNIKLSPKEIKKITPTNDSSDSVSFQHLLNSNENKIDLAKCYYNYQKIHRDALCQLTQLRKLGCF